MTLPVEFDASRRARQMLRSLGLIAPQEEPVVRRVLSAAAMTYVAATLTSVRTLAYYLLRPACSEYAGSGRSLMWRAHR